MPAHTQCHAHQEQQQELASARERALPILLQQPAFHQHDARLGCALLGVSKGAAADVRRLLAGQLDADVRLWSAEDAAQLAAWLRGPNAPLLRSLTVRMSTTGLGLAELAAGLAAAAAAPASGLRLRSLRLLDSTGVYVGEAHQAQPALAVQLVQALPVGLTALQLGWNHLARYEQPDEEQSAQFAAALVRLSSLRSLQLGASVLLGPVLDAVASLQGLTSLAAAGTSSEGCARLPASLMELHCVERSADWDLVQPADLGHLTALTALHAERWWLPPGSSVPPSLRRLALDSLSGVEHLLPAGLPQLTSLQLLSARDVPATQLLALTQLERLAEVSLCYEDSDVPTGSPQDWAALPILDLSLQSLRAVEVAGLSRLTRLTRLELWGARYGFPGPQSTQRLAHLLPSLTVLQELRLASCAWGEEMDLTALASAVARLPNLRELGWYRNEPELTEAAGLQLTAATGLTSLGLRDSVTQRVLLALTRLTGLKQLDCDMQAAAVPGRVLAAWAQRLTRLECLALSGAPASVACLSALSRLTRLDLDLDEELGMSAREPEAAAVLRRCRAARWAPGAGGSS